MRILSIKAFTEV